MSLMPRYCCKCGRPVRDGYDNHVLGCPPPSADSLLPPELFTEVAKDLNGEPAASESPVQAELGFARFLLALAVQSLPTGAARDEVHAYLAGEPSPRGLGPIRPKETSK